MSYKEKEPGVGGIGMTSLDFAPSIIVKQIEDLKAQQDKCTRFLLECISVRDQCPQYAQRIDVVINTVETVMSQNADLLARMEADVRSAAWV